MKTLFDILSLNERVIVWSDAENDTIYTWNMSLTLQAWFCASHRGSDSMDHWEEVDVRTLSDEPKSFEAAREAAKRWAFDVIEVKPTREQAIRATRHTWGRGTY